MTATLLQQWNTWLELAIDTGDVHIEWGRGRKQSTDLKIWLIDCQTLVSLRYHCIKRRRIDCPETQMMTRKNEWASAPQRRTSAFAVSESVLSWCTEAWELRNTTCKTANARILERNGSFSCQTNYSSPGVSKWEKEDACPVTLLNPWMHG